MRQWDKYDYEFLGRLMQDIHDARDEYDEAMDKLATADRTIDILKTENLKLNKAMKEMAANMTDLGDRHATLWELVELVRFGDKSEKSKAMEKIDEMKGWGKCQGKT